MEVMGFFRCPRSLSLTIMVPDHVRNPLDECLRTFGWLLPRWVRLLEISWRVDELFYGECKVQADYGRMYLQLGESWLGLSAIDQARVIAHEFMHAHLDGLNRAALAAVDQAPEAVRKVLEDVLKFQLESACDAVAMAAVDRNLMGGS